MKACTPHYWLYSESGEAAGLGHWRFLLRSADGAERLEADEVEQDIRGERLELLAVVRGLEALDQPSRVTLVTPSTYVREGIRHGISEWQRNGWCWEFFGHMVPVKHQDLWKRVERALAFHDVDCRTLRVDAPHRVASNAAVPRPHGAGLVSEGKSCPERSAPRRPANRQPEWLTDGWKRAKQWWGQARMALAPSLRLG
jgi:ribonuclease HI